MDLRFAEGPRARRAQSGPRIGSETTTKLAAAVGEDVWTAAETPPGLLVAAGRE